MRENVAGSQRMEQREMLRGSMLTLMGGAFWGLAGVFGKYSFEHKGVTAQWLVSVRLVIAGLLLLTTVFVRQKQENADKS